MQSQEEIIKRISSNLGLSYSEVESMMYKGVSFDNVDEIKIEELKQAIGKQEIGWKKPKRLKKTNYTKPKNRKKKPKRCHSKK